MSDSTWTRIGDDKHAPFGKGTIAFERSDNGVEYNVIYDDDDQDRIYVSIENVILTLDIFNKQLSPAGIIAVSGMITEKDDLLGIEGAAWGELVFAAPPVFHFYGNAVLIRSDTALT